MPTSPVTSSLLRTGHLFTWSDDLVQRVLPSCRAIFDELATYALGVTDVAENDKAMWIPGLTGAQANALYYGYLTAVDMLPAIELDGRRLCIPFFIAYSSRPMVDTHHTVIRIAPSALHVLARRLRNHLAGFEQHEAQSDVLVALDALESFAQHVDTVLARLRVIPLARIEELTSIPLVEPEVEPARTAEGSVPTMALFFC